MLLKINFLTIILLLNKMVEVMGWRTIGTKLTDYNKSVEMDWEKKEKENPQTELF